MVLRRILLMAIGLFASACLFGQVALKTNVPMDALLIPNIGLEVGISQKWTLDVPLYYNPWSYKTTENGVGDKMLKLGMISPELRYWLCDKFNGHFFGVHLLGGVFKTTGIDLPFSPLKDLGKYRYKGNFYGGGVSWGYQWILGKHWNLGLNLGLGYAHIDWEKYECEDCGDKLPDGKDNYFGPTKAALNLIYVF